MGCDALHQIPTHGADLIARSETYPACVDGREDGVAFLLRLGKEQPRNSPGKQQLIQIFW